MRLRHRPAPALEYLLTGLAMLALTSAPARAQPSPAPASGDALCEAPPTSGFEPDLPAPDSAGFRPLFNGTDFTGWWLDCGTAQSQGSSMGPIFRVDKERQAIYSSERGSGVGGVLMTRARFADYEIVFDYWPDWQNEASLLNRADSAGRSYATRLGYAPGTTMGGAWGEAGLVARDFRPFTFNGDDTTISIPGNANGIPSSWTRLTRGLKESGESFPCPETGCAQEDWRRLWDPDGWNQIRILFRGGGIAGDPLHARTWFRKSGAADWVPLEVDTTLTMGIPPGFIGLQVHQVGALSGNRGTWYRNIRWKPWLPAVTGITPRPGSETLRPKAISVEGERQGIRIDFADKLSVRDVGVYSLDGKPVADLRGIRGEAFLPMPGRSRGLYLLRVQGSGRQAWFRFFMGGSGPL